MNNYFDITRFGRLCLAQWAENWREYAWFAAVGAMINLIFILIIFSSEAPNSFHSFNFEGQIAWYLTGLFASGLIFAGRHFRHLTQPGAALITLMRPASHLEKWLLAFLAMGVLFPLVYTLVIALMNFPMVTMAKHWSTPRVDCVGCTSAVADFRVFIPFLSQSSESTRANPDHFIRSQVFTLLILWSGQGLIASATLYFRRSPILRTTLALFVLFVLILWSGISPHRGVFWSSGSMEVLALRPLESLLSLALWTGLPVLIWLTAFFHLKEREVA